jgi:hypothetical protein
MKTSNGRSSIWLAQLGHADEHPRWKVVLSPTESAVTVCTFTRATILGRLGAARGGRSDWGGAFHREPQGVRVDVVVEHLWRADPEACR